MRQSNLLVLLSPLLLSLASSSAQAALDDDEAEWNLKLLDSQMENGAMNIMSQIAKIKAEMDEEIIQDASIGMEMLPQGFSLDRTITQGQMGLINQYGCWCYFEDDYIKGMGQPMDELDKICKDLNQGYRCIILDMEEQGTSCIPYTAPYSSAFGFGKPPTAFDRDSLIAECDLQNPSDECARATCKVEGWFMVQYFNFAMSGGQQTPEYRFGSGFDHDANCRNKKNPGVIRTLECCGIYPTRYTYYDSSKRKCCAPGPAASGKTYHPYFFECCSDGTVEFSC